MSRDDKQPNLRGASDISLISCSVALASAKPASESLQLLKSERAFIAGLSLRIRSDGIKLGREHPEICAAYKKSRGRALDTSQTRVDGSGPGLTGIKGHIGNLGSLAAVLDVNFDAGR